MNPNTTTQDTALDQQKSESLTQFNDLQSRTTFRERYSDNS
jgi:hypothetical protein